MKSLAHTTSDIQNMLHKGLVPITDNADALANLGFQRAYPHIRVGYDSTIWERSIDVGCNRDGKRLMGRQRAYLSGRFLKMTEHRRSRGAAQECGFDSFEDPACGGESHAGVGDHEYQLQHKVIFARRQAQRFAPSDIVVPEFVEQCSKARKIAERNHRLTPRRLSISRRSRRLM
jgi:hypothetical protein